ncbi:MFS transporter [Caulobacter segnis]|uniref:MFS transporter n=1 Tax=Caulobacter segnis TaxID=88688 RepID=UPI00240EBDCF|nr:MFS transporter [Caulobacter segnis]MDG2521267.1 MFS transporter [Caulobacter segnis]
MSRGHHLPWAEYFATLQPHERPQFPGSPATPDHPAARRMAYAAVGVLVAITGSLGNAVVTANLPQLAGALGATTAEAAWLPVVFVMTNACMNLLLIKFRMQYGLQLFTRMILGVFVLVSIGNLFISSFTSAIVLRAVAGMCAAGMSTLGFLYLIQAFPAAHRLKGLIIGIGLSSFALPLARIFSSHLLDLDQWRAMHLFELGMALASLAAVFALRLPPSERLRAYDRLDFVTFALFAPGVAMLCAVLGLGRIVWWTEAAWIGWALAGSMILLSAALIIEFNRKHPLINLHWMASGDIIRLVLAILLVRIVLSEQTSGAVGFLQQMGLGPDQMHGLFWVILAAMIAGTLTSAFTLNVTKLNKPIAIALALIAVGAFIDSHATVLTRPQNLFLTQSLLAFASAFFIGPALLIGISQVMAKGAQNLVSFIVLFSIAQNVGGLAGGAIVGTVQTLREKFHSSQLTEAVNLGDPQVVLRLQQLSGAYARVVVDPAARNLEGMKLLSQQIAQQANVLAYNDVFLLIAAAAAAGSVWVTIVHLRPRIAARRAAAKEAAEAATDAAA